MKKINLIILLTVFYIVNVSGQGFIPGITAGINYSYLKSDKIESTSKMGYEVRLNLLSQMGDNLDLISEFTFAKNINEFEVYQQENSKYVNPSKYNLNITSLNYNIIANYYLIAPKLSLQFGPSFFSNFNRDKTSGMYLHTTDNEYIDIQRIAEEIAGFNFGLTAGISGGSEAFRVNVRYYMGLINYMKNSEYNNINLKGNMLEISITYYFLDWRIHI